MIEEGRPSERNNRYDAKHILKGTVTNLVLWRDTAEQEIVAAKRIDVRSVSPTQFPKDHRLSEKMCVVA